MEVRPGASVPFDPVVGIIEADLRKFPGDGLESKEMVRNAQAIMRKHFQRFLSVRLGSKPF